MTLPDPLVAQDVDLRGLPFMPLDVGRLRDSNLAIEASGDEFRAAVLLWCASWNQVPAGSLPDNDAVLASYAGYGRDVKGWKRVRQGAMRGFVACSDGRLYHPVVCEKAKEAWGERTEYRENKNNEKARKQKERDDRKRMFEDLRAAGVMLAWNTSTAELRARHEEITVTSCVTLPVTVTGHDHDTAKTGTGTGTGTGIKDQEHSPAGAGLVDAERQPGDAAPQDPLDLELDRSANRERPPNCPFEKILDLYHLALPELPAVLLLTDKRKEHLRSRWRESPVHQDLQFWAEYFAQVKRSRFLLGKTAGRNGEKPFRATFDWLLKPSNFVKVIEGNYDDA